MIVKDDDDDDDIDDHDNDDDGDDEKETVEQQQHVVHLWAEISEKDRAVEPPTRLPMPGFQNWSYWYIDNKPPVVEKCCCE